MEEVDWSDVLDMVDGMIDAPMSPKDAKEALEELVQQLEDRIAGLEVDIARGK
jgi:hypothetical protein